MTVMDNVDDSPKHDDVNVMLQCHVAMSLMSFFLPGIQTGTDTDREAILNS